MHPMLRTPHGLILFERFYFSNLPDIKEYPEFYKIEEQKVKIDASAEFKFNNRTYLGYFVRKENDFYIVEIF